MSEPVDVRSIVYEPVFVAFRPVVNNAVYWPTDTALYHDIDWDVVGFVRRAVIRSVRLAVEAQ
jgi:hypothetical protein